ncbi:hypothetical protein LJC56_01880 [Christensenellaceae bacterium OttesenSCG-928-K19]|nr:hypothetical protein [Christensenellaceae bacterium OttesenSCG-928-K19]
MDFKASWQRACWRICSILVAAAACICFFLIGEYLSKSYAANGYLSSPDALYSGTVLPLAAACLLLALGCATSVPTVKYNKLFTAGFILGAASAGVSVAGGVVDAAAQGLLSISGAFSLLAYLLLDICTVVMFLILTAYFGGRASHKAARWASGILLLINLIYVLSVILYYASGNAEDAGLLYPWSNLMALATMVLVFIATAKRKVPTQA